ncbi:MAG: isochorismatase family protein [Rhizobiales bacterium]|nr:isochorismatase family protein [Hyphomicrobiales bacterium]
MRNAGGTARQMYEQLKANPREARFGFGTRPALVNVDLQRVFTDTTMFPRAYETDPRQIEYINRLAAICRQRGFPVIWSYVAYHPDGHDAGVWGTRSNTPESVQNMTEGSERVAMDPRAEIDHARDVVMRKRMPSVFFETNLPSLLAFHKVDTLIVTGGSTSGCVRATVVDGLSSGYRMIVPEECVADRDESPHYANLYDMSTKYADVISFRETESALLDLDAVIAA